MDGGDYFPRSALTSLLMSQSCCETNLLKLDVLEKRVHSTWVMSTTVSSALSESRAPHVTQHVVVCSRSGDGKGEDNFSTAIFICSPVSHFFPMGFTLNALK